MSRIHSSSCASAPQKRAAWNGVPDNRLDMLSPEDRAVAVVGRRFRKHLGLTLHEAERRTRVGRNTISAFERGLSVPGSGTLRRIIEGYGLKEDYFWKIVRLWTETSGAKNGPVRGSEL